MVAQTRARKTRQTPAEKAVDARKRKPAPVAEKAAKKRKPEPAVETPGEATAEAEASVPASNAENGTTGETTAEKAGTEKNKPDEEIGDDSDGENTESDEGEDRGEDEASKTAEESNSDSDGQNEDAWAEKEALKPLRMYFPPEEYRKSIKLSTRCHIEEVLKTFNDLEPPLSRSEMSWFEDHPQFCHIMHIPKSNHMVQPMWMLLLRTAEIERKKEVWFVVNGIPIRYGLREHALISGLDCHNYPVEWKRKGSLSFKNKYFPEIKKKEKRKAKKTEKKTEKKKEKTTKILREDVRELLKTMGPDDTGDRLKMAVLYFLSSIVYCHTKVGTGGKPVLDIFVRYVDDLDLCNTFPWGRFSFDLMLESIHTTVTKFVDGEVSGDTTIPGFCLPLELLALEAIPELSNSFREPVAAPDDDCPRMCRSKWQKCDLRGWPLETVYDRLGKTQDIQSVLIASEEEKVWLDSIMEAEDNIDAHDPVVESWEERLNHGLKVEFQDMMEEDLNGREKKEEETAETGWRTRKITQAETAVAVRSLIDQMAMLVEKVDKLAQKLGDRITPLEEYVRARKGNVFGRDRSGRGKNV